MLGVMGGKCGAQHRQLLVGLEATEALGGFQHRGAGPAQCHRGIAPAFHVAADPPQRAHHVLDDVGAGQRAAQLDRQPEPDDRQHLVDALQDAGRDTGRDLLQPARQVADQPFRLRRVIQFPRLTQHLAHRGMKMLGKTFQDVASLVDLAALDRRVLAERLADRAWTAPSPRR